MNRDGCIVFGRAESTRFQHQRRREPGLRRASKSLASGFRKLGPLVVVALLVACDVIAPPPVGRIAGRVIIEGQGVAGVTVSLRGGLLHDERRRW